MSGGGGEKTEKPTEKRRKESRKEGQVPRTQELGGWASLLVVGAAAPMLLARELGALRELMVTCLTRGDRATPSEALGLLGRGGQHILYALVILGCMVMLVGVGSALSQGGLFFATKSLKPKLSKLDPIKGFKRTFGPHALWEGAKILLKSTFVGVLVYLTVRSVMPLIGGLVPIRTVLDTVSAQALGLVRNIAFAGLTMAAADYAMQRRRIGKQTRMSKEEVKQEHRQTEGDPLLKSAMRSRQLAAARNRMMADVPTADVVLVNPTHVAVALRYEPGTGAPKVVAKGAGAIAAKIREEASDKRVPMIEDIPLTRALHATCELGQEVPAHLFTAVARVLAFVMALRRRGASAGQHRVPGGPTIEAGVDHRAKARAARRPARKPATAQTGRPVPAVTTTVITDGAQTPPGSPTTDQVTR